MNEVMERVCLAVESLVVGKRPKIRLALSCLAAGGHLLIEDVPGVGKTLLAHALAKACGLDFSRVQFTSDLLPADIIGLNVYSQAASGFVFHPGPVFSQVVLADEINRASPKTQSALLEAMEERQVSVEGVTRKLPEPFFVVATQNPVEHSGAYPLPDSQLDRFLMRITLGYPDPESERRLWSERDRREMLADLAPAITPADLLAAQAAVEAVHAAEPLLDYVQRLVARTRREGEFRLGLSPRAGRALLRAAKSWAHLEGRDYAVPDDVQAVFAPVAGHRLVRADGRGAAECGALLREVEVDPATGGS